MPGEMTAGPGVLKRITAADGAGTVAAADAGYRGKSAFRPELCPRLAVCGICQVQNT